MTTKHQPLIDSLFPDAASRLIAMDFVTRFGSEPMMADRIPALLHEVAAANARVGSGDLSPQQGREYLSSFAAEGLGCLRT
jgi:hypothetical protein